MVYGIEAWKTVTELFSAESAEINEYTDECRLIMQTAWTLTIEFQGSIIIWSWTNQTPCDINYKKADWIRIDDGHDALTRYPASVPMQYPFIHV